MCKGLFVVLLGLVARCSAYEVVYALNAGGREFVDSAGIEYEEDTTKEGFSSNHGARYSIDRVPPEDASLYQTEKYSTKTFSYTIPLNGEGKYLLVLKFSEVFFEEANKKVFDVVLNDVHSVLTDLDIYREAGHATAHDEYIPFTVSRGKLFFRDGVSEVRSGRLKISFIKGQLDNPKINAIVLVKGADAANDFPRLPPPTPPPMKNKLATTKEDVLNLDLSHPEQLAANAAADNDPFPQTFQEEDEEAIVEQQEERKFRRTSGPKQPEPVYAMDSSVITILFIAVATVIPIVILRCRL